jgi:hypothetical protein
MEEEDLLKPTKDLMRETLMGIFDIIDKTVDDPELKRQVLEDMKRQLEGNLGDFM